MRDTITIILLAALMLAVGCGSKEKILGKRPKEKVYTILAINAGEAPMNLSLEGTIIEKCPQAGCWFRLDDGTGVIKVDTKLAGFVVIDVPLNTKVKVAGALQSTGGESVLNASGLAY